MGKLIINVPDGANISQEQIQQGLALLQKANDAKAKEKAKMSDPAYKEKVRLAGQKTLAYQKLMMEKAKKAGITVTTEEVEAYLKSKVAK